MPKAPALQREILLAFWKVHVLHHAEEGPVYGQWIAEELREHGYAISPGTLYPMLRRMEANGWLRPAGLQPVRRRRELKITPAGRRVLRALRQQVTEMYHEVVEGGGHAHR